MRILVLSPGFPLQDEFYGHAVAEQVAALAKRHEVCVQSLSSRPALPAAWPLQSTQSRGLTVLGPPPGSKARRLAQIWSHHRNADFDLIWSLWLDRSGPAGAALARLFRIPWVASVLGGELADLPALHYGGAQAARARKILKGLLRDASMVTVGSQGLVAQAQRLGASESPTVAPVGVQAIGPGWGRSPWKAGRCLDMATVTDAALVKGADRVFGALASLCHSGTEASLTVFSLAEGDGRARLERMARVHGVLDRVTFLPPMSSTELQEELRGFHVLVSGSAHESQGLAFIEAALAGVPVVAPSVGVMPQLQGWGAAWVTADANAQSLAATVVEAAGQISAGTPSVASHFEVAVCADRFEAVFNKARG